MVTATITATPPPKILPTKIITLPTQDELPCDDDIPMETGRHKMQMDLLIDTTEYWLKQRSDGFTSGNMFVYFSASQLRNQDFRGPDFFVVLGVPKGERKSWVVWEEEKAPDVVIELLSESTIEMDKVTKKQIYQDKMRVGEYFWYDPHNPTDWAGFSLQNSVYQPIPLDSQNRYISQKLGLALVRWEGSYRDIYTTWLRWTSLEGELVPNKYELAERAEQHAEQVQRYAEQVQQQAEEAQQQAERTQQNLTLVEEKARVLQTQNDRLAAKLKELGIDPGQLV